MTFHALDLEDLEQVALVARRLGQAGDGKIDMLFLNAGMQLLLKVEPSISGVERTFAANHLGHFLLLHCIMPYLATAPG